MTNLAATKPEAAEDPAPVPTKAKPKKVPAALRKPRKKASSHPS